MHHSCSSFLKQEWCQYYSINYATLQDKTWHIYEVFYREFCWNFTNTNCSEYGICPTNHFKYMAVEYKIENQGCFQPYSISKGVLFKKYFKNFRHCEGDKSMNISISPTQQFLWKKTKLASNVKCLINTDPTSKFTSNDIIRHALHFIMHKICFDTKQCNFMNDSGCSLISFSLFFTFFSLFAIALSDRHSIVWEKLKLKNALPKRC